MRVTRPKTSLLARQQADLLVQWARRKRGEGAYNHQTLASLARAWELSQLPAHLLEYLLFRRDLGRPLPQRWVGALQSGMASLGERQLWLAKGLMAEACPGGHEAAMFATENATLSRINQQQPAWREAFARWLEDQRAGKGVCLVGNSARLLGKGMGPSVDERGAVVRFNRMVEPDPATVADTGEKMDVWVMAPGYIGPVPQRVAWVVISGPDMRYRLQDWSVVAPLLEQGIPILTVPLSVWRYLVRQFQAPPSAGVLTLAWFNNLLQVPDWQGVSCVGIGAGLGKRERYHVASPDHKRNPRHNWFAEEALVKRWQQQGLHILAH